ncbi:interferon omega-2-like [Loxodonta africana]|uniref:interferon omega-2-like n=1 Tax=Loxodonta africana TaxID=9785 RepID=UPI0030CDEA94
MILTTKKLFLSKRARKPSECGQWPSESESRKVPFKDIAALDERALLCDNYLAPRFNQTPSSVGPAASSVLPVALLLCLLTALVVFSCGPAPSLGCDLPQNHSLASEKIVDLLDQIQRLPTFFCLDDRKDFRFPQEMVDGSQLQKAQAIAFLHEMLQQIFDLFRTMDSFAAWNTTRLHQLLSGLLKQQKDLETCFVQAMEEEKSVLPTEGPALAVKEYFEGIRSYLKEKEYSDCAWEFVRVEIRGSFSSSTALQERLRRKHGDMSSS